MDKDTFIELVRELRRSQKAYFKNGRKQSDLIESKRLEKLVDEALAAGFERDQTAVPDESEQPKLL
jgi:hypothetical protein